MLVFAGIVPRSPLLTPTFSGKEGVKLEKTKRAFALLEQDLYISKAQTIIVITAQKNCSSGIFTVNLNTQVQTDYTDIGDVATKQTFTVDVITGTHLKEHALIQGFDIQMITQDTVDHGVGVPFSYLSQHLPDAKVIPVNVCDGLDAKKHFAFGYAIKEVAMKSDRPIAVIAAADLSHALTSDAPAGYAKEGKEFDAKIQELLSSGNATALLTMDPAFVEAAAAPGYKAIVTLMGCLQRVQYTFKALSYEAPHGVGYMVAQFSL